MATTPAVFANPPNACTNCGKTVPHQPSRNTDVPLTTTVVKTHMQYLHLGNTLQFAEKDQNIL